MPKQRISSVDIRYLVRELRESCLGLRLSNLYDVTPKIYMLKFAKPDHKEFVIVESGVRIHTTGFMRAKPTLPSAFTLKLRKAIRTWRLEAVDQVGVDRIVDFTFGRDETAHHLIFEFYAKGNIILTDHEYTIISLLRTHKQDAESLFAVREHYPIERAVQHVPMTETRLLQVLKATADPTPIKQVLNSKTEYGPAQVEHCLLEAEITPNTKITAAFADGHADAVQRLLTALQGVDRLIAQPEAAAGYVYKVQPSGPRAAEAADGEDLVYEHFSAFPLRQYGAEKFVVAAFPTFTAAVDDYFSKFEDQRATSEVEAKQQEKLSKVDKVKRDHEQRIGELQKAQGVSEQKAELIILNAEEVDAAIAVIRSALAQSIDWTELKRVVKEQRKTGNPIAMMIHGFHFEENRITLLLTDSTDDAAEEDLTAPAVEVSVDISLSAMANARAYFDAKRKSAAKEDKTKSATQKAVKSAQKKCDQELKKEVPTGPVIKVLRKPYWFEKFQWFITTENLLVISGRDSHQNELLVKRYLKPGDLYIHADLHGATSCIIKNPSGKVVPPVSLSQAGTMCVCRSAAWDNKTVTSAWWVYHNQVSKTAPTGEYLPTGSFMIRGKKNFLPPNQLIMGLAILWKVSEECIPNHVDERRPPEQFDLNPYHLQTMPDPLQRDASLDDDGSAVPSLSLDAVSEASPLTASVERDGSGDPSDAVPSPLSARTPSRDSGEAEANGDAGGGASGDAEGPEEDREEDRESGSADGDSDAAEPGPGADAPGKRPGAAAAANNTDFSRYSLQQNAYDPTLGADKARPARHRRAAADEAPDEGDGEQTEAQERTGKKKMSAKERRMLKQQQKRSGDGCEALKEDPPDDDPKPAEPEPKKKPPPPVQQSLPRGKKAKLKKIQQKYADQDDEDRELAMLLLGHKPKPAAVVESPADPQPPPDKRVGQSGGGGGGAKPQSANHRNRGNAPGAAPDGTEPGRARGAGPGPSEAVAAERAGDDEGVVDEKKQSDADQTRAEGSGAPNDQETEQEVRALLKEEGMEYLNEEEKDRMDLNELSALTGNPLDSDDLLFAIPMCGPYSALQGYKYKVKVTPGTMKRGKAVQATEKYFFGMKTASLREKTLLRSMDHMDMIAAMMGNSRVSIPGAVDKPSAKGHKGRK